MKNSMEIIYLPHYYGIEKPCVKDVDNAGIDLRAAIDSDCVLLVPQEDVVIPSGIKLHIGSHEGHLSTQTGLKIGLYGSIDPRSGLGFKHYLRLANTRGIIDAGYQNEIMVKVRNEGTEPLTIHRGDRICQLVISPYIAGVEFEEVEEFTQSAERGEKGFGSSGVK